MRLFALIVCLMLTACQTNSSPAEYLVVYKDSAKIKQIDEQSVVNEFKSALQNKQKVLPKKTPDYIYSLELVTQENQQTWLVSKGGLITQKNSKDNTIYKIQSPLSLLNLDE